MKQHMEFSKILAVLVTAFFFGTITFSLYVWYVQDRIPSEILSTISIPFSSVIAGYFVKAGYENGKKIENNKGGENNVPTI